MRKLRPEGCQPCGVRDAVDFAMPQCCDDNAVLFGEMFDVRMVCHFGYWILRLRCVASCLACCGRGAEGLNVSRENIRTCRIEVMMGLIRSR